MLPAPPEAEFKHSKRILDNKLPAHWKTLSSYITAQKIPYKFLKKRVNPTDLVLYLQPRLSLNPRNCSKGVFLRAFGAVTQEKPKSCSPGGLAGEEFSRCTLTSGFYFISMLSHYITSR